MIQLYGWDQYKYLKMTQITIISILQKIGSLSLQSGLGLLPEKAINQQSTSNLQPYFKILQQVRVELIKYRNLDEEYSKLQTVLQRQQTQIRKRIGIEQQLKLYTDALKIQVEELQRQKIQLLQNSKTYIKQLKKTNEHLYTQLHASNTHNKSKSNSPQRTDKSKHNKSLSQHKSKQQKSIRQIIKTQYIDRDRSNSAHHKKNNKNKVGVYSTVSGHEAPEHINQNAKTFQVVYSNSGKKQKHPAMNSKKKHNHLFSNYTLLNFLQTSNKKIKKQDKNGRLLAKSPGKKEKKKEGTKSRVQNVSKALWKEKKTNKSVFSVASLQPNSSKKQTL